MNIQPNIFISRKSADAQIAKKIYDYFFAEGLVVFESDHLLIQQGRADYGRAIDEALINTQHLLVLASNPEYFSESWVDYEWRFYHNRLRMGTATGNLVVVISPNIKITDIPAELQHYQVFYYEDRKIFYQKLNAYFGREAPERIPPDPIPPYRRLWFRVLLLVAAVAFCTYLLIWQQLNKRPYDMTVFLKTAPGIRLHPDYPKFKGGQLSVFTGAKEETRLVDASGEVMFKELQAKYRGKKVPIRFTAAKWKLTTDSITLGKSEYLTLVPDGSLATIKGTVTNNQTGVDRVKMIVSGADTFAFTDNSGLFNINLPYHMQQDSFQLQFEKPGYETQVLWYFPMAGLTNVVLKRK